METVGGDFSFSVVEEGPQKHIAKVLIGKEYVSALYKEVLFSRKKHVKTHGFSQGDTPLGYIEQNFRAPILEHLKELFFAHCVIHLLYDSLATKKIVVIGDPDLIDIKIDPEGTTEFIFRLTTASFDQKKRWQNLRLKPLKRKNYRDLDRQVENFMHEELTKKKQASDDDVIKLNDWVNFKISLLNNDRNNLMPGYASNLWVRIESGEDDKDLQELFLDRKIGDTFTSHSSFLQEHMSTMSDIKYFFQVTIQHRVPGEYFSLDLFRRQFSLEHEIEIPAKLIEVFSMRNDITLRRETIEAVFKLLHKHYFFRVPQQLLEIQKQTLLEAVKNTPDYQVYKARSDFKDKIRALAEKDLKEAIIVDAIAYQEGITVDDDDLCAYLNLLRKPRMKSFVYFKLPDTHSEQVPISSALLKRYCLREKTLNHLIKEITQPKL